MTLSEKAKEIDGIKNDIISCYTNLKSSLTEQGVEYGERDKMNILIEKIRNIKTGKKWAKGSGRSPGVRSVVDTNLEFEPSIVFVLLPNVSWYNFTYNKNIGLLNTIQYQSSAGNGILASAHLSNINKNSLTINVVYASSINEYTWYAFE